MDNEILIKYLPVWRRYLDMLRGSGLTYWRIGQLFVMMMEYHFEGKEPRRAVSYTHLTLPTICSV